MQFSWKEMTQHNNHDFFSRMTMDRCFKTCDINRHAHFRSVVGESEMPGTGDVKTQESMLTDGLSC